MKRPFKDIRPVGPLTDRDGLFSAAIGSTKTGSSPADEFDEMFDSFTIVLEYNLKSSSLISEDDLGEEGHRLESILNDYLFTPGAEDIIYFMRGEVMSEGAYEATLMYGVDGDIWEGRLDREGKYEGSIAGTEDVVNANLSLNAAVMNSYMHIYPTEKAKEIQETGSIDMGSN